MTSLKLAVFLLCLCWWRTAVINSESLDSVVHQDRSFASANIGENVTLRCFYDGKVAARMHWYKQTLGQKPQLISTFSTLSKEFQVDKRFTLRANVSINHLIITYLLPSDSATYYCVSGYAYIFHFANGTTLSVKGSGWTIPAVVRQSQSSKTLSLSCTVSAGSCDGEHSVYWIKNSEESQPGLIYTHGDRNDQCERKLETKTCVYNLPVKSLKSSHAGILYCAVVTCGRILFGNGSISNPKDEKNSPDSLVLILSGALGFTIILAVLLTVHGIKEEDCRCMGSQKASASVTSAAEGHQEENLHFASLKDQSVNRLGALRDDTWTECVYFLVRQ